VSVLYCTIPHFSTALACRDDPAQAGGPLVLIGPEERVFGVSAEAAACGVAVGMTARMAQVRCPEARLREADLTRCRTELESLLQLLEGVSSTVEPHGWGSAYVDLGSMIRGHADAVGFCREVGQAVRRELGEALQPALGWDSSKFTAQAAARRIPAGHLRAINAVRERAFLRPLPVSLLPLEEEVLQRLHFLGLRTLGQYAVLSPAAVWQQFGRAGKLAQRCARGEDDRPVVSRRHTLQLTAEKELEAPLVEQERLRVALKHLVAPLLAELRGNLQACGQVRLEVGFEDGSVQERERAFLLPVVEEERIVRTLGQLLDNMSWPSGAASLAITLAQIQDAAAPAVAEQLALFPLEDPRKEKLREVERYLATRFGVTPFGGNRLRRAVLAQPGAPLPEWRVSWRSGDEL